jgi:NAD(P)-dependent dehydrogenase (short-subunit alcohol dehydrogenase family)
VDVADQDAGLALFGRIGEFDHLVYTAGEHIFMRPVANVPPADARGCFDTRFFGAFAAAQHALPRLRPGGSIVLTSGVIAVRPAPNTAIPAAVSGAVEALVRALAVEAAPIRVNAVRLGPVPTDLTGANRGEIPEREKIFREVSAKLLTRRMGRAEEAAAAYLHLMKNTFTTGVILPTDGGFVLV